MAVRISTHSWRAQKAQAGCLQQPETWKENDCYKYAAIRNILYNKGKTTEVMVSYEPCYTLMNEWWKQLYGESEGKDGKGLFPASVVFSTDLHSMGQYIQDGRRSLFETVMLFEKPKREVVIGNDPANVDGLNFLEGKSMAYINRKAFEGHRAGTQRRRRAERCDLRFPDSPRIPSARSSTSLKRHAPSPAISSA